MTSDKKPTPSSTSAQHHDGAAKDGLRETIESVVIAFVLAFLFRTFEAEAFVIPTGSMAPTLMGRHYDTTCPKCGFPVKIGASEENVEDDPTLTDWQKQQQRQHRQLRTHVCPNCRYEADFGEGGRDADKLPPSYNGDRIIVSKFPYEIGEPQRWDVAVFRYPATPKTNYIKRIVGLPGETLRIQHGDIHTRATGSDEFQIQRKPPHKVPVMLQTVYDNDYVLPEIIEKGWPLRWATQSLAQGGDGWKATSNGKSFSTDGNQPGEVWLRYRHYAPSHDQWQALERGPLSDRDRQQIRPLLVSDMYSYNSRSPASFGGHGYDLDVMGLHWVGDLALECTLDVQDSAGAATLELVEAGRKHRCRFDLSTGQATLSIDALPEFKAQAKTAVRGPCRVNLRFANVDDQLLLWVDDSLAIFDGPTTYGPFPTASPREEDRSPAGIAVEGTAAKVEHLRLLRDIYYIADNYDETRPRSGPVNDYESLPPYRDDYVPLFMLNGLFPALHHVDFDLGPDQFLAMGDNSPKSKDSRLWTGRDAAGRREYYVHRDLLVGKAMFIYWPHAWVPDWAVTVPFKKFGTIRLPFYPNFSRMQFIR